MAKDPICGMTVDEATGLHVERDGQTFSFCSEHCRQTFLGKTAPGSAPLSSVAEAASSCCGGKHANARSEHDDHTHGAHAHNDEHEHGTLKPSATAKYFCPMCAGVESDKPGDCPKCGMALERNPAWQPPAAGNVLYTCPMHPEVRRPKKSSDMLAMAVRVLATPKPACLNGQTNMADNGPAGGAEGVNEHSLHYCHRS